MGIMQTKSIIDILLAAAAFLKKPLQKIAAQSLKDAYEAAKSFLRKKLAANPDALDALDLATAKPESMLRKALLIEESAYVDLAGDAELVRLINKVAALLPISCEAVTQSVRVIGHGNRVQVAGRDVITTEKIIARNTITPDDRHVSVEQREQLLAVIRELADRLAGFDGKPNFSGAHRMLQRRFNVASYLLLPFGQFSEALAFLKQQRAIHRASLQRHNPVAYRNDLFRSIFAGARELKWDGARVYVFAAEVLGLNCPVSSLKALGPVQLKALAIAVQRHVAQSRRAATA